MELNNELKAYIETEVLPRYDKFDKAHQRPHAEMVIAQSLEMAEKLGADINMAYTIAAFHDTGLAEGRETHHEASARIILTDKCLPYWFTQEQIRVMAEAAEDHRASAKRPPRSLYGKIVSEADRYIDAEDIIRRTIQYGLDHYPALSREGHYNRMVDHLREKYGRGGYLKLWFEESPNKKRLEHLQQVIDDESQLLQFFNKLFSR